MHPRKKQIVKAQGGIPAYPARFRYEPFTVFATFLADGLRVFRKGPLHSHPIDFEGHAEDWGKAIDKMIWSFDQIAHEYPDHPYTAFFEKRWKEAEANGVSLMQVYKDRVQFNKMLEEKKPTDEETVAYTSRVQEGLNLFAKYFQDLWD